MTDKKPKGFKGAFSRAKQIIDQPHKLDELLSKGKKKAEKSQTALYKVWEDFQCLWRMIEAWRKGDYKKAPWKSILYALVAIIYFINPFDVVPDFIPIAGFIDDVGMISFVLKTIQNDLNEFKNWEKIQSNS